MTIKEYAELIGAKLPKCQQWLLEKFLSQKEPEYIIAPRHSGETTLRQLSESFNKLLFGSRFDSRAMITITRGLSKSGLRMSIIQRELLLEAYRKNHPRVVHLAYHAKKARVRKKNRNRIRRMK